MTTFSWGHAALRVDFLIDAQGRVRIAGLGPDGLVDAPAATPPGGDPAHIGLPLIEVLATGHGRHMPQERVTATAIGGRLAYQGHAESHEDGWLHLRVDLTGPEGGLAAG